jgi:hypothetical protein
MLSRGGNKYEFSIHMDEFGAQINDESCGFIIK